MDNFKSVNQLMKEQLESMKYDDAMKVLSGILSRMEEDDERRKEWETFMDYLMTKEM